MEILLLVSLGATVGILAWRERFRPKGWLLAWTYLFFIAGLGRWLLYLPPPFAPKLIQFTIVACFLVTFASFTATLFERNRVRVPMEWGGIITGSFAILYVMIRHLFPVYDVDSLNYHIPGLVWLYERPKLTGPLKVNENYYVAYKMLGFEEHMAICALNLNLAFFMGLLQGFLKLLAYFSLAACIPCGFWIGRFLLLFILCKEDHFFFSGLSRWVYLTPSFIALLGITSYCSWRAWRGHRESFWVGCCFLFGLATIKYHGLMITPVLGSILALSFWKNGFPISFPTSKGLTRLCEISIATSILGLIAIYGTNWWETGSPFYPFGIGPFQPSPQMRATIALLNTFPPGNFWSSLISPYETIRVLPANLSMRLCFYFMFPVFLLFAVSIWERKLFFPRPFWTIRKFLKKTFGVCGGSHRSLSFAAFCCWATWLWAAYAQKIVKEETRYPVFIFGLTSILVVSLLYEFRPRKLAFFYGRSWISIFLGTLLCVYLALTTDTRVTKIDLDDRVQWPSIRSFLEANTPKLSVENSVFFNKFELWVRINVPDILKCIRSQNITERDIVVISPRVNWPAYLLGATAVRADPFAEFGLQYVSDFKFALIPRVYLEKTPEAFQKQAPAAVEILKKGRVSTALCGSEEMALVHL